MDKTEKQLPQHEQVKQLCNNVLYVLQHCMYRGEDAHLVELSKEWMKEIKRDIDKRTELEASEAKQANEVVVAVPAVPAVASDATEPK